MRTQVAIVGAGPAGLLLGCLLHDQGIDTVVVERRSREHVRGPIRAGVLEQGTVALLERAHCATRLHAEGLLHDGVEFRSDGDRHRRAAGVRSNQGLAVLVFSGRWPTPDDLDAASKCTPARTRPR